MELQLRREPDLDPAPEGDPGPLRDEQLRLIFLCCHPALAPRAQITLTLRLVVGLTPSAIAAVLFESDAATTKRLVRARAKIRDAVIPFRMPGETELEVRLRPVLAVLYLVYTEGHTASSGPELGRVDLCVEAIRLARLVSSLRPDEPEVQGRLALLLLYDHLVEHQPSPVVHLHRAVAVAVRDGAATGLALLDQLALEDHHLWHVARAELLGRLDRVDDAVAAIDRARRLVRNDAELRHLLGRRAALVGRRRPGPESFV